MIMSWSINNFVPDNLTEENKKKFLEDIKGTKMTMDGIEIGEITDVTDEMIFAEVTNSSIAAIIMDGVKQELSFGIQMKGVKKMT